MELTRHGLRIVERPMSISCPLDDGALPEGRRRPSTEAEVAKFSARDADAPRRYYAMLDAVADVLRDLVFETPPNQPAAAGRALPELLRGAASAAHARGSTCRCSATCWTCSSKPPATAWMAGSNPTPIKAAWLRRHRRQLRQPLLAPARAYVLLHHMFGEVNGKKGAWGHAIGGMGAITQAMARPRGAGVEISLTLAVREVIVERRPRGRRRDRERRAIARALRHLQRQPEAALRPLIEPGALPAEFRDRIEHWRCGSGTFRMNVALCGAAAILPALPGRAAAEHHTAGIIMAPTLAYMDQAYVDARRARLVARPIVEMLIPRPWTTASRRRAACGEPVLPARRAAAARRRVWDDHREEVADLMIDLVNSLSANFKRSLLDRQITSRYWQ